MSHADELIGKTYIQYALVGPDGEYATVTHQDDEETPLISSSLIALINWIGDWCDCDTDYVLKNLKGDRFTDKTGSGETYRIVRETVTTTVLDTDDLAEVEQLREANSVMRAKFDLDSDEDGDDDADG